MEEIIMKIMSIDKKATDIMKQTEEYLKTKEKDIKGIIEAMRNEIIEKTKLESKNMYDSIISDAEVQAEEIRTKTKQECDEIEDKYAKVKGKLEKDIFTRIFN